MAFGSLEECVRSGLAGRVVRDERWWAEATGQDGGFGLASGGPFLVPSDGIDGDRRVA